MGDLDVESGRRRLGIVSMGGGQEKKRTVMDLQWESLCFPAAAQLGTRG